eukprot:1451403-Alexandrium_andersonii.AAC.1
MHEVPAPSLGRRVGPDGPETANPSDKPLPDSESDPRPRCRRANKQIPRRRPRPRRACAPIRDGFNCGNHRR